MMRLRVTDTASSDVNEILGFYRAPSAAADAFARGLESELFYLRQWPYTGHRRRDLSREDVCFRLYAPYLLVLQIDNDLLSLVAVLHSSRNIRHILRKRFKEQK